MAAQEPTNALAIAFSSSSRMWWLAESFSCALGATDGPGLALVEAHRRRNRRGIALQKQRRRLETRLHSESACGRCAGGV